MDARELRAMSEDDILDDLEDLLAEQQQLRFDAAIGQLEDTNLIRKVRRNIARIKSTLRERELASSGKVDE
jgi:large subunit ribosomal protein L29